MAPALFQPRGQPGVILEHGSGTHQNGIHPVSHPVDPFSRLGASDPLRLPGGGGDFAIQRKGGFQDHPRGSGLDVFGEFLIELPALRGQHAVVNRDPGLFQPANSLTRNQRVGIAHADENLFQPAGNDGIGTGWRASVMATGLQIHEHLRPPGLLPGFSEGLDLAVRPSSLFMVAFGDHPTVFHDDGPDPGIGRGSTRRFSGHFQSPPHPLFLLFLFHDFTMIGTPAHRPLAPQKSKGWL